MPMGGNHQMAIVVWVSVHHDKGILSSMQDKVLPSLRRSLFKAKDAPLSFIPL
jgi:hypothetical protein